MLKNILVIDDEANMRHMLSTLLAKSGYTVEVAADGSEGLARIEQHDFDFILCDLKMPVMDGMTFLSRTLERQSSATVIMMSAYGTVDQAIETVKQGAYDYISKPFKVEEILLVLRKAEERERLRQENVHLKEQLDVIADQRSFGGMVGKSKVMQEVFQLAEKVARYNTTILITGESGTGKELVARGIHLAGKRRKPRLWLSTVVVFQIRSWRANFSGTSKAPLPARTKTRRVCSKRLIKARCFSMKSGSCHLSFK